MTPVQPIKPSGLHHAVQAYMRILGGATARLGVQAAYFALLVNTLSLADYGVFASALAAALVIANGGTYGFAAPLFRAATIRRRLLGHYLSGFYVYAAASLPLTLILSVGVYGLIFESYLSLAAFLAIALSEALCWRLVEGIQAANLGLGRYSAGVLATLVGTALRALALVAFRIYGDGQLETWAFYYFAANVAAALIALAVFHPRTRLRWNWGLVKRNLGEAFSYEFGNFVQSLQGEADKLLILTLTSPTLAGLYALSMRIIDLASVPVRSFLTLYVKRLLGRRSLLGDWTHSLKIEAGVALVSLSLFAALVGVLSLQPTILGANVAAALPWFSGLFLIPPAKLIVAYHREIFFAANRILEYAVISFALLAVKIPVLALVAIHSPDPAGWIAPLNAIFVAHYCISGYFTWKLIFSKAQRPALRPTTERLASS